MTDRVVTATILRADNSPWVGGVVSFLLDKGSYTASEEHPRDLKKATTDNAGQISISLWVNSEGIIPTKWICTHPSGESFEFVLPAGISPVNLSWLRSQNATLPPSSGTENIIATLIAAHNQDANAHDLTNQLSDKADTNHGHTIGNVSGLQTALDGKQPNDALLSAIAALNTAADQLIYTIGADQVALTALTSFARSLLAATNAAAVRTALELPISDQGGALVTDRQFAIDRPDINEKNWEARSGGSLRWRFGASNAAGGHRWRVQRFNAGGTYVDEPLSIDSATGSLSIGAISSNVSFTGSPNFSRNIAGLNRITIQNPNTTTLTSRCDLGILTGAGVQGVYLGGTLDGDNYLDSRPGSSGFFNFTYFGAIIFRYNSGGVRVLSGSFSVGAVGSEALIASGNRTTMQIARLGSYTLATLPSASGNAADMIYCSNLAGGAEFVFSDGTNWRRFSDRTIAN